MTRFVSLFGEKALMRIARDLPCGELRVIWPCGRVSHLVGRTEGPAATIHIRRHRAVRRMVLGGFIGFAEGYMDGDWDTPDLGTLLWFGANIDAEISPRLRGAWVGRWINRITHASRRNSRRGSRRNIASHYDLGNAFYEKWLDGTMTYSAAIFEEAETDLVEAQNRKYRLLADALDLRPGQHVLEIGCGWGAFAVFLARERDCRVTALTLSRAQYDYASAKVRDLGLENKVEIRIQDYRDVLGTFDRIASIEMFEAVGEAHWPKFFERVRALLAPGGKAALQIICIAADRFNDYRRDPDFIQRYIFPGGMLPSTPALRKRAEEAGLEIESVRFFGKSYARTLECWNRRFQSAWPHISELRFDARFKRMWEYYLLYCAVGFRSGAIDVGHFRLLKEDA
jgi:cyclopropane-fatty-acyl-phospholipid synthase